MYELRLELAKHYKKKGNKFLFGNVFTLNSLSIEMWKEGVDAPALSRILKGEKLFNYSQLKSFCALLKLPTEATELLFEALQKDYLDRKGFQLVTSPYSSLDIIDLISTEVDSIHNARERGLTSFVMDRTNIVIKSIEHIIAKETKEIYKKELYNLLGEIYSEKSYASGCTLNPEENMEMIFPLVEKQIELAKLTNNIDLYIKAKVHLAFAFYAQGNYQFGKKSNYFYSTSLLFIREAIAMQPKSTILKLLCWRLVALNSIYLKKKELFLSAKLNINTAIDNVMDISGFSFIPWALDSISRGQSYFGDADALKTIERSREYSKKISWNDPLRETAIIRNELEVLQNLNANKDNYIHNQAERGLALSSSFGFSRYTTYFNDFLAN